MQESYRIGDHELCVTDYLQVVEWAREAETNADDLLLEILIVEIDGESIEPIIDGKIRAIDMSRRGLKKINVSNLNQLRELRCYENQLDVLDVSNLNHLEKLYCYKNQLTELDVSSLINSYRIALL